MDLKNLLFYCLALLLLTTAAYAAPLPEELREALPPELAGAAEDGNVLADGAAWLWESARESVTDILRGGVRNAALLTLAALICGAAEGLADGAGETAARYVPFCGVLAAASLVAGDLRALIGLGARTVDELGALAKLLLPALAASMAAGGFVSTASVWQVTTLMACGALSDAVSRLLLPLVYCFIAASAAGALMDESGLDRLADGIRRLVSGALKLVTAAFASYLAVSGVLTGSADRAAVKAAKVVVAGTVPVVGGVLADAAESVLSGAGALRATLGATGVLAVLALCLTPLLRLGIQFLIYKCAAFLAGIAGPKALGTFLDRLGEAFALVFAMTAAAALILLSALLVALAMTTA